MKLQKFGIKLYLKTNGSFASRDFIPVFHKWIQDKSLPGHLLIDVADYSHIPDGPGIMLIAHEGYVSLDQENQKPGLLYMRKKDISGKNNIFVQTRIRLKINSSSVSIGSQRHV